MPAYFITLLLGIYERIEYKLVLFCIIAISTQETTKMDNRKKMKCLTVNYALCIYT